MQATRAGRAVESNSALPRRNRAAGRPPIISRAQVLHAGSAIGQEIGLESVTIQAVADRLGVSRTAVYGYVAGTNELRRLVAKESLTDFKLAETRSETEKPTDWQTWIHHVATAGREWRLANAPAEPYMSVNAIETEGFLAVTERTLEVLHAAGFTPAVAARALEFISGIVWINTHDQMAAEATGDGTHPQQAQFNLAGMARLDEYPLLQRSIERDEFLGAADTRFEFEIRCVITALEAELALCQSAGDIADPAAELDPTAEPDPCVRPDPAVLPASCVEPGAAVRADPAMDVTS